jgi:hypothetical protein
MSHGESFLGLGDQTSPLNGICCEPAELASIFGYEYRRNREGY